MRAGARSLKRLAALEYMLVRANESVEQRNGQWLATGQSCQFLPPNLSEGTTFLSELANGATVGRERINPQIS